MNVEWKCNLDWSVELCVPRYSFTRLDAPFAKNAVSKGYNFRYGPSPLSAPSVDGPAFYSVGPVFCRLLMQICQIFQDRERDRISEASQSVCHPLRRYGHWKCEFRLHVWSAGSPGKRTLRWIIWCTNVFCSMTFCLHQAGKFDTIPTLINLVAAFTSVGLVRPSILDKGHQKGQFC